MNESDTTKTNENKEDKKLCSGNLRQACPKCNSEVDSYKNFLITGRGGTTTRIYLFKCSKCGKAWRKGELERVEVTSFTKNCKSRPLTKARKGKSLRKQVCLQQFEEMQKTLKPREIATLLCQHFENDEDKAVCPACRKAIVRMRHELEEQKRKNESFAIIDHFDKIPEIQRFIEFQKAKGVKSKPLVSKLKEFWEIMRSEKRLSEKQRPMLWDREVVQFLLAKIEEKHIATYGHKQALRQFFESVGKEDLRKHPLLKARKRDMRSPNGKKRLVDGFPPTQVPQILAACDDDDERFIIQLHITLKSREGKGDRNDSLLGVEWNQVRWEDSFYGFPMVTMDVFEPKTSGGTWWKHCPLDLWFNGLSSRLKERWEREGRPSNGKIFHISYLEYVKLWRKLSERLGVKLLPHDCRRSPGGWLRDLGLPDLALGQYDGSNGEAFGYTGAGWENPEIYYQHYGKMNPLAIYDSSQKLDVSVFDGLILKILRNRFYAPKRKKGNSSQADGLKKRTSHCKLNRPA